VQLQYIANANTWSAESPGTRQDTQKFLDMNRAYAELSLDGASKELRCKDLLDRILSGLAPLFVTENCHVKLRKRICEFHLGALRSRALLLLASELVVNSLKHGYHGRVRGVIKVSLTLVGQSVRMAVVDEGCGIQVNTRRGTGTRLLKGLYWKASSNDLVSQTLAVKLA